MIKFAVISDSHLGHNFGTELEDDSFDQFGEALNKAIAEKVDFILLPGDIFDVRIPRQEVWAKAFKLFQKPLLAEKSNIVFARTINKENDFSSKIFDGIPVIAIHGTHERRGEGFVNPVHILEKGGFLIHLHTSGVILEKGKERIAIQGLSGVPEEYVREVLEKWSPRPVSGCKNIFVFHQSLKECIYDENDTFISVNDLPNGFDLYVNGHIHWRNVIEGKKKVLFPGSTIITQQRKTDADKKKGLLIVEIDGEIKHKFIELESQRPFYYEEIKFNEASTKEVVDKSREALSRILSKKHEKRPMIKLALRGSLEKGKLSANVPLDQIVKGFNAIISIDKGFEAEDLKSKIESLRLMHQQKRSVEELGISMVKKMLADTKYSGIPPEKIIDSLSEGENDAVIKKVLESFRKPHA